MNRVKSVNTVLCLLIALNAIALGLCAEPVENSKNVKDPEMSSTVAVQAYSAKTPEQILNSVLPRRPSAAESTAVSVKQHQQHHHQPNKNKKKMSKGKHKKKQSYKDKLLPLLLIPVVLQVMTIPSMIMNLKMMAMKAMLVGKLAMILVVINFWRNLSLRAVGGDVLRGRNPHDSSLMSQHYGYNGGLEFGSGVSDWVKRR